MNISRDALSAIFAIGFSILGIFLSAALVSYLLSKHIPEIFIGVLYFSLVGVGFGIGSIIFSIAFAKHLVKTGGK